LYPVIPTTKEENFMYSKAYWITCDEGKADALMEQYNTTVDPAVKASDKHVGHHMIESGPEKWLLISNYTDKSAADSAASMVQELVKPMIEQNGMTLEIITAGEATHSY
jgi:sarcosine oxidase gamma subunit